MATFTNQATLNFGTSSLNSNVTTGEVQAALSLTKTAVSQNYGTGDGITYILSLVNNGTTDVTGVTLTDDLGAYSLDGGTTTLVPLDYVDGSILYYSNGVLQPAPTVSAEGNLTVSGITVPSGGGVTIIYEARANSFAPLAAGSSINNTVSTLSCPEALSSTASVPVREETALSIAKSACPGTVNCGDRLTYTFVIQNTGNVEVPATDNLTVTDTFLPILSDIEVTLNGTVLTEGVDYTYNGATGEFATLPGAVPVPAATYTSDPETGAVTVTPGFAVLTVSGTV